MRKYDFTSEEYVHAVLLLQRIDAKSARGVYRKLKKVRLHGERLYGTPGNVCYCPIGNYIRDGIGDDAIVRVNQTFLHIGATKIPLPEAVAEFVEGFDAGMYRKLRSGRHPTDWCA